jgi:hypothetical protein
LRIALHLSGIAIASDFSGGNYKKKDGGETKGRKQGSLKSYQKRLIANATEWLRQNATYKPYIFVATISDSWDFDNKAIAKFCHNLKNGYKCKHYIWVKEQTKRGYAHYHFIADLPMPKDRGDFKIWSKKLSGYWYSLHNINAIPLTYNSIRFGTRPKENGKRDFYVKDLRMAWYISKYLAKGFENELQTEKSTTRRFSISSSINRNAIEPVIYTKEIEFDEQATVQYIQRVSKNYTEKEISYVNQHGNIVNRSSSPFVYAKVSKKKSESFKSIQGKILNTKDFSWRKNPLHNVYFGFLKKK